MSSQPPERWPKQERTHAVCYIPVPSICTTKLDLSDLSACKTIFGIGGKLFNGTEYASITILLPLKWKKAYYAKLNIRKPKNRDITNKDVIVSINQLLHHGSFEAIYRPDLHEVDGGFEGAVSMKPHICRDMKVQGGFCEFMGGKVIILGFYDLGRGKFVALTGKDEIECESLAGVGVFVFSGRQGAKAVKMVVPKKTERRIRAAPKAQKIVVQEEWRSRSLSYTGTGNMTLMYRGMSGPPKVVAPGIEDSESRPCVDKCRTRVEQDEVSSPLKEGHSNNEDTTACNPFVEKKTAE